ncbi:MAG: HlyD family efflux transporter periplasmic adaptor subunit [bacterium]
MKNSRFGIMILAGLSVLAVGLAIISPRLLEKNVVTERVVDAKGKDETVAAKGIVESEEEIEVSNLVAGSISEVRVHEGDRVRKGQILIILDNQKIITRIKLAEAMLNEARARLRELETGSRKEDIEMAESNAERTRIISEKARKEYERQKRLYQKEATTLVALEKAEEEMQVAAANFAVSRADLKKLLKGTRDEEIEQARSAVEKANSELSYYQALLEDYTIISPIDGLVAEQYQDAGEIVNPGTPLMKLINPDRLRIRAELEEADIGKVTAGQRVAVSTDAYPGREYPGKVYKLFPVLKRHSLRTFDPGATYDVKAQDIYARLDDPSGLKNGMTVTVRFLK